MASRNSSCTRSNELAQPDGRMDTQPGDRERGNHQMQIARVVAIGALFLASHAIPIFYDEISDPDLLRITDGS